MPRVIAPTPSGYTMAMSRITGTAEGYPFWKMVSFVREDRVLAPLFDGVEWDSIRDPLDFECFLLGSSWMTLRYDEMTPPAPMTRDTVANRINSLLLVQKGSELALVMPRWWPASATEYKNMTGRVILPAPMLDSQHLEQFIRGAEFMIKLRGNHPSETYLYAPSLVLCCMKEKPPGQLVTKLCDLILPRHRLQKMGRWGIANNRTWLRLLAGQEYQTKDLSWYAKYKQWLGLLASPWLTSHARYYLTRTLRNSDAALVSRLSLPAFKEKLRALKRNKGDDRWLRVLHSGYYILEEEDDEIMAMLPAILNPRWAQTASALLEHRPKMLKLLQNTPRSFKKLPQILINGGSLKVPKL